MSRPSVGPLELALVALIALLAAAVWQHLLPKQEIVGQFVSVATFVITTFFLVTNYQNNVRSNSAKMVMDFAGRIDSPEMRKYRVKLAKQLVEMRAHAKEALSNQETIRPEFVAELGIVNDAPFLDFLEDIGYFTKKGILDSDMVWNSLIWSVERYYLAITSPYNYLEDMRKGDYPELYERFKWLYGEVFRIDRSKRPKRTAAERREQLGPPLRDVYSLSDEQVDQFLQDEARLLG